MKKLWHDDAWNAYLYWIEQDKKTLKRINSLLRDIERNGYFGIGKPEPLRFQQNIGWWSVRVDEKNRLVFKIENNVLIIAACLGHYGDH